MRLSRTELLVLPFLLPFTSAVALSSFQVVVSNTLPKACLRAYNATIPDCTTADFTNGNPCSAACVEGLKRIDASVKQACAGASASITTLLGTVLNGNMPKALCPNIASQSGKTDKPTTSPGPQATGPTSTVTATTPTSSSSSPSSTTSTDDVPATTLTSSTTVPVAIQTDPSPLSTKAKKSSSTAPPGTEQTGSANSGLAGSPFQITLPNQGVRHERSLGGLGISTLIVAVMFSYWF